MVTRVKYKWDQEKDDYIIKLQTTIKDKVLKAQLETTSLVTDLLAAANKKHSAKIKKYLQTGNEADMEGALNVDTLQGLMKLSENLLKITGQDRQTKSTIENRNIMELNVKTADGTNTLSSEDAAKILNLLAESKRKKENTPTDEGNQ